MKILKSTLALALVAMLSFASFAGNSDKVTEKARALVSDSSPDDWQALAKAADLCVRKEVNLTEAKAWFEKSLEIKENTDAYEVAGDYYMVSKLYDKAIENYIKGMLLMKENNINANTYEFEEKIAAAKKLKDA